MGSGGCDLGGDLLVRLDETKLGKLSFSVLNLRFSKCVLTMYGGCGDERWGGRFITVGPSSCMCGCLLVCATSLVIL